LYRGWESAEKARHLFWLSDHAVGGHIDQSKEGLDRILLVANVDLSGVDGVIADHSHNIKRLLNFNGETFLDQVPYVLVDIVALLPQLDAQQLDTETE
jgi:hypothetical protein